MRDRETVLSDIKKIVKSFADVLTPMDSITLVKTISDLEKGRHAEEPTGKTYDLDFIRFRASLVDYVKPFLSLKKFGKGWRGHCPFHDDSEPSFHIYEGSNRYHCFGCNKSGSIFDFIMEQKGVTFRKAIEEASECAGELPEDPGAA